MPRGYRLLVIAIGLILSAASQPRQGGDTEQRHQQTSEQGALRDIASSLQEANKPDETTKPCPKEGPDRKSDLCAQWKAADAAEASAYWTQATFWLGISGVFLGFLTLIAAGAAAKFAREAVMTADRALRDGDRAFIYPEMVIEHGIMNSATGKLSAWQFWFPWKNSGSTAARRCEAQVNAYYLTQDLTHKALGLPFGTLVSLQ